MNGEFNRTGNIAIEVDFSQIFAAGFRKCTEICDEIPVIPHGHPSLGAGISTDRNTACISDHDCSYDVSEGVFVTVIQVQNYGNFVGCIER